VRLERHGAPSQIEWSSLPKKRRHFNSSGHREL
jgi:hypothetical protein